MSTDLSGNFPAVQLPRESERKLEACLCRSQHSQLSRPSPAAPAMFTAHMRQVKGGEGAGSTSVVLALQRKPGTVDLPAVLTLGRQKEEDQGFKVRLSYMKLCFKTSNNKEIGAIPYSVSCRAGSSLTWAEKVARLVECLSGKHKTV